MRRGVTPIASRYDVGQRPVVHRLQSLPRPHPEAGRGLAAVQSNVSSQAQGENLTESMHRGLLVPDRFHHAGPPLWGGAADKVAFWQACRRGRPRDRLGGADLLSGGGRNFRTVGHPRRSDSLSCFPLFHRSSAPVRLPARRGAGGRRALTSHAHRFWCDLVKNIARAHRTRPAPCGGRGTSAALSALSGPVWWVHLVSTSTESYPSILSSINREDGVLGWWPAWLGQRLPYPLPGTGIYTHSMEYLARTAIVG